jgi:hypothetical protein
MQTVITIGAFAAVSVIVAGFVWLIYGPRKPKA